MQFQSSALALLVLCLVFTVCSTYQKPRKPEIKKLGTVDLDVVEANPVVFKGKLLRFEYVRKGYWNNRTNDSYFRFVDHETGDVTPAFGQGFHMGCAFVENDTAYITAVNTWDGEYIFLFKSADLENWEKRQILHLPGFGLFNTSLCRADKRYVLMYEIGKPKEEAGERFTARFATSTDLIHWEITPPECNYAKDRYTAPHCLRYLDGYFYNFYLESHQGYETRVVRSPDLIHWEPSPFNPVLVASAADKEIYNDKLMLVQRNKIQAAKNINNSDIDFCEFNGKLIINYSWGNQQGTEFLAEAVYNGTLADFLEGWFPDIKNSRDD